MSSLRLVPLSQRAARDACANWHRHNPPPQGDIFRVGVATDDGTLVAVGFAGRPVARHLDDGQTVEITRVASDGTYNTTSMIYGALTRAAFALGYRRVVTYTQAGESGASLRATAGFRVLASRPPRPGWPSVSRPRDDARYQSTERTLWEAVANE
jgi:hypothetical protein